MAATELLKLEALPAAGGDGRRVRSAATGAWLGRGGCEGEQLRSLAACDSHSSARWGRVTASRAARSARAPPVDGVVFFLLFLQKNCIAKTFYGTVFFLFLNAKSFTKPLPLFFIFDEMFTKIFYLNFFLILDAKVVFSNFFLKIFSFNFFLSKLFQVFLQIFS